MSEKERIKKELEELSPLLSELKAKADNPFQVPTNYFQSLQDEVLRKVAQERVETKKEVPVSGWLDQLIEQLQWLLQPRYAMAMVTVAILIVAGIFFFQPSDDAFSDMAMSELTEEDIADYIASNIEDFEVDLLVEAMGEEVDPTLLPTPALEEEDLEEYLDDIIDEIDLEELEEFF